MADTLDSEIDVVKEEIPLSEDARIISIRKLAQNQKGTKPLFKCPKCRKFDRNKCPNNLKLHMFHHYLDYWSDKLPDITSNEIFCQQCEPHKKIVGANIEGCRIALICHRAIHHEELRKALIKDTSIERGFIEDLYEKKTDKAVKVLNVGTSVSENENEVALNIDEERERIAQEVRKREMIEISSVDKQNKKKRVIDSSNN